MSLNNSSGFSLCNSKNFPFQENAPRAESFELNDFDIARPF